MADPFTGWAVVELPGRRRIAGYVTADAPLLSATRLQVELYDGPADRPAATMYTSYPVYCLTPCTEAIARKTGADALRYDMPVAQWQPPAIEGPDEEPAVAHAIGCDDPWQCDGRCIDGGSDG